MQEVRGSSPRISTILIKEYMNKNIVDFNETTGPEDEGPGEGHYELPHDVGAVTIVDGRIVSMYQDPAIGEYLRFHEVDVAERAAEIRKARVAEATAELLAIWEAPEDGAWAFRQQNHHGNR
jgi:hypothetical protein